MSYRIQTTLQAVSLLKSVVCLIYPQEFRRDEFPYHFQNVHSDIHGGLNGWLEQRCPLAPYGCTYSQRRFHPGSHGARIIHSEGLESFGVVLSEEKDAKGDSSRSPQHRCVPLLTLGRTGLDKNKDAENSTTGERTPPMEDGALAAGAIEKSKDSAMIESKDGDLDKKAIDFDGTTCSKSDQPNSIPVSSNAIHKSCSQSSDMDTDMGNKHSQSNDVEMDVKTPPMPLCKSRSMPSPTKSSQSEEGVDYLSELPLELLRYLTKFLDGFSMCNLAMTSKLLRQICCSMLEERGMVVLQWEKRRGHWDVAYKVSFKENGGITRDCGTRGKKLKWQP